MKYMILRVVCAALLALSTAQANNLTASSVSQVVVFEEGTLGFACFRIPILLTLPSGDLLAFVEARKESCSDYHARSILVKRSQDRGASWGKSILVSDVTHESTTAKGDGLNLGTALYQPGNDTVTAKIWLAWVECFHKCTVPYQYIQTSSDNGETWDPPRDITNSIYALSKFAPGPGYGLYVKSYFDTPRMVMCGHYLRTAEGEAASNLSVSAHSGHDGDRVHGVGDVGTEGAACIYSDDLGGTWKSGIPVSYNASYARPDECQPVSVSSYQNLLMTMRDEANSHHPLWTTSYDGGISWEEATVQVNLTAATCDASLVAINITGKYTLFFSRPASTERENMEIHTSPDQTGAKWSLLAQLWKGPAAYSCMQPMKEQNAVGVLYENGEKSAYERITFAMVHYEVHHGTDGGDIEDNI